VTFLHDDVLAGEKYDGELIVALASVSAEYWQENTSLAQKAVCALNEFNNLSQDSDLLKDASNLMSALGV